MIEEIMKHAPKGATHWQAGAYYKNDLQKWFYWDREWFRVADLASLSVLCMTPIPKSIGFDQGRDITNSLETLDHPEDYTSPNCKKYER
ncbi:MAG: hypothetical protein BGN93_03530 [Acinetobacter sp. 39-4]|nr:MAG: hypothetical protein BGN93_03530 [Acinetobacter sp. 39-4]